MAKGEIYYIWNSPDEKFLKYNPQIWLFRYNKLKDKKSFKHPVHYNTEGTQRKEVEYSQGESPANLLSYSDGQPIDKLTRTTEFPFSTQRKKITHIPVQYSDFFFVRKKNAYFLSSNSLRLDGDIVGGTTNDTSVQPFGNKSCLLAFAIVIDSPNQTGQIKKIVGQLSTPVEIKYVKKEINYFQRICNISTKRFKMIEK